MVNATLGLSRRKHARASRQWIEHTASVRWKIAYERIARWDGAPRWRMRFDQSVATTPLTMFAEVSA